MTPFIGKFVLTSGSASIEVLVFHIIEQTMTSATGELRPSETLFLGVDKKGHIHFTKCDGKLYRFIDPLKEDFFDKD